MTSSLVGSEMCIRDRAAAAALAAGDASRWRPLSRQFQHSRQPRRQGKLAVSYTHLTLPTICSV
eukprot:3645242-Prorocentrum_lima.AAC.1